MNGFRTSNFARTGRAGKRITIGKGNGPGASRAISLVRNTSDRNSDSNGKPTISRGLKFGNISNPKHKALTANSHNSRRGTNHNRNNTRRRVSNLRNNLNTRRDSSSPRSLKDSRSPRDNSSLRSRGNPNARGKHSTNSLKENLREAIQVTSGDILRGGSFFSGEQGGRFLMFGFYACRRGKRGTRAV